jgi:FkbM family methyltransferase
MPAVRDLAVSVGNHVPGPLARPFRSGGLLARTTAPLLERLLPTDMAEVVVRSGPARGLRLLIDPQHEKYYWTGAYERRVQETFEALLRPGDVVWDVGAHIGFFSLLAARQVSENGVVHAIEPSPTNRHRLEANLRLNKETKVRVHAFAVGRERGRRRLYGDSSTASFAPRDGSAVSVESRTLDELLVEVGPPHLVKLDVEEAELECLQGGRDLLTRVRPLLVVELHDDADLAEARTLLGEGEYELHPLSRRHWLARPEVCGTGFLSKRGTCTSPPGSVLSDANSSVATIPALPDPK